MVVIIDVSLLTAAHFQASTALDWQLERRDYALHHQVSNLLFLLCDDRISIYAASDMHDLFAYFLFCSFAPLSWVCRLLVHYRNVDMQ